MSCCSSVQTRSSASGDQGSEPTRLVCFSKCGSPCKPHDKHRKRVRSTYCLLWKMRRAAVLQELDNVRIHLRFHPGGAQASVPRNRTPAVPGLLGSSGFNVFCLRLKPSSVTLKQAVNLCLCWISQLDTEESSSVMDIDYFAETDEFWCHCTRGCVGGWKRMAVQ